MEGVGPMTLTFSLLFMAFVVLVSVKLWRVLDRVERHLDKLDNFLGQRGNASSEGGPAPQERFDHQADLQVRRPFGANSSSATRRHNL